MNTQHPQRRLTDRSPKQPRHQVLVTAADRLGVTELVRFGSLAHAYMVEMAWECLDRDGDHCLMRAPEGWTDGSVFA